MIKASQVSRIEADRATSHAAMLEREGAFPSAVARFRDIATAWSTLAEQQEASEAASTGPRDLLTEQVAHMRRW